VVFLKKTPLLTKMPAEFAQEQNVKRNRFEIKIMCLGQKNTLILKKTGYCVDSIKPALSSNWEKRPAHFKNSTNIRS
jgi:hypothetical protein